MSLYSWDRRITRAERLAKEYPASAEMLTLYVRVARFQQSVYDQLKTQSADIPMEQLEPDFKRLLCLMQTAGPAPLAEKASELLQTSYNFSCVLSVDDPSEVLLFFKRVLIQPYMEYQVGHKSVIDQTRTTGRCPACGEWPQVAVLRAEGEGGKRWLLCSQCSTEWEFRRLLCPHCGEENQDLLPVYTATEFAHVRVEACDRCQMYIKSVDLTKDGLAVPCVDDLATIALDVWAQEHSYAKLQANLMCF